MVRSVKVSGQILRILISVPPNKEEDFVNARKLCIVISDVDVCAKDDVERETRECMRHAAGNREGFIYAERMSRANYSRLECYTLSTFASMVKYSIRVC